MSGRIINKTIAAAMIPMTRHLVNHPWLRGLTTSAQENRSSLFHRSCSTDGGNRQTIIKNQASQQSSF